MTLFAQRSVVTYGNQRSLSHVACLEGVDLIDFTLDFVLA